MSEESKIFRSVLTLPWNKELPFNQSLKTLLSQVNSTFPESLSSSPVLLPEIILRAKLFYFHRFLGGSEIPVETFKRGREPALQAFEKYDFDGNKDFQAGLKQILEKQKVKEPGVPIEEHVLRAKIFFYTRAMEFIDFDEYKYWKERQNQPLENEDKIMGLIRSAFEGNQKPSEPAEPAAPSNKPDLEYTGSTAPALSLNEVMKLIQNGESVPGVRQIPATVSEEKPSPSVMKPRLKPWETAETAQPKKDGGVKEPQERVAIE